MCWGDGGGAIHASAAYDNQSDNNSYLSHSGRGDMFYPCFLVRSRELNPCISVWEMVDATHLGSMVLHCFFLYIYHLYYIGFFFPPACTYRELSYEVVKKYIHIYIL